MDFDEYQTTAKRTDRNPLVDGDLDTHRPQKQVVIPLLGLVGEVASLAAEYKKLLRDGATHRRFRDEVKEELGDILWYVANVASKFDLSMDEIARENLAKVADRWGPSARRPLYDEDLPLEQQLPRQFAYNFQHRDEGGAKKLVLVDHGSGAPTGDPLTDNAYDDDGYRYHDVLHLGLAAQLGWSPVYRKLLRSKGIIGNRMPRVDEVEDGGRAQVVEEAIVAAAYVYAADHDFLVGVDTIDWQLLRHIKQLTAHVEVRDRTARDWNDALVVAFGIWRKLRDHGGGVVSGDLRTGSLAFTPPPEQ